MWRAIKHCGVNVCCKGALPSLLTHSISALQIHGLRKVLLFESVQIFTCACSEIKYRFVASHAETHSLQYPQR